MIPNANQPTVSILIPAHNAGRFIEETLVSVLAQTFTDFECLVINDGSTDRTAEIVEKFLTDRRVRLINLAKVGLCTALNQGLELCRAPLVARMDADDVMLPERLAVQLAFMEAKPEIAGCSSDFSLISDTGFHIGEVRCPLTSVDAIEKHLRAGGQLIYSHPTVMYRREIVLALGGYRSEYFPCEDVDLFVRMLEIGKPVLNLPTALIKLRVHSASVSSTSAVTQFHTNKLIFRNLAARRRGKPDINIERYFSDMNSATGLRRFLERLEVTSFILHRKAAREKTNKHRILGNSLLIAAIVLNPYDAYKKTMRLLRR
jgi:glycosyltransferase involved in cell wall biosynthesis